MIAEPPFRIQFHDSTDWALVFRGGDIIGRVKRIDGGYSFYPGRYNVERATFAAPSMHLLEMKIESTI